MTHVKWPRTAVCAYHHEVHPETFYAYEVAYENGQVAVSPVCGQAAQNPDRTPWMELGFFDLGQSKPWDQGRLTPCPACNGKGVVQT